MSPRHAVAGGARADFLAIVGPTASGKTAVSLAVAETIGAEIVSVDSRQVYRGMDIGTAKATLEERSRIAHYGFDLVDPNESYSAGAFARDARSWIEEIRERGKVPLLVGGTGFFLRGLLEPFFAQPSMSTDRLKRLRPVLAGFPRRKLEAWTRALDPARLESALQGGPHRMTRTLEVALLTGRSLGWWHENAPAEQRAMRGRIIALELPAQVSDRRIRERVSLMIEAGLVAEVEALLAAGYTADDAGMTGVGYREVVRFLDGKWSLEEVEEAIWRATRQFARRQRTWFRNQLPDRGVLRLDGALPRTHLVDEIVQAWSRDAQDEVGPRAKGGED